MVLTFLVCHCCKGSESEANSGAFLSRCLASCVVRGSPSRGEPGCLPLLPKDYDWLSAGSFDAGAEVSCTRSKGVTVGHRELLEMADSTVAAQLCGSIYNLARVYKTNYFQDGDVIVKK